MAAPAPRGRPCGELGCLAFATPAEAFAEVLATKPKVLAIGETHAQKARAAAVSSTRHFTEELLPLVKGSAKHLVLELWVADGACGKEERVVAAQQKQVTAPQAETNQNEFVTLGRAAEAQGTRVSVLRPSCPEYQEVAKAGDDAVLVMLSMITRLTEVRLTELAAAAAADEVVLAYGGAMHNDLAPPAERAAWSFGPSLATKTAGRYVELDLIVPEAIGDTPTWKAMPWRPFYDPAKQGRETLLYRQGESAFTLIFPPGP